MKKPLNHMNAKGWRPKDESELKKFKANIVEAAVVCDSEGLPVATPNDAGKPHGSLQEITGAIQKAVAEIDYTTAATRRKAVRRKPPELKAAKDELEKARRFWRRSKDTATDEEAEECIKGIREARRVWRKLRRIQNAKEAALAKATPVQEVEVLTIDGVETRNREEWRRALEAHCKKKFVGEGMNEKIDETIRDFTRAADFWERDGMEPPPMTIAHVLRARSTLKMGSSGGGDGLVAEVLLNLPLTVVAIVHSHFVARYRGWWVEDLPQWRELLMFFLQKIKNVKNVKDYRGVTLLNLLSKWYCGTLMLIYEEDTVRPARWLKIASVGFRPATSVAMVASSLLMTYRAAWEWRALDDGRSALLKVPKR